MPCHSVPRWLRPMGGCRSRSRRRGRVALSLRNAGEVLGGIDAAAALVFGDLRIGADRARSGSLAAFDVRADDHRRRLAFLYPVDHRGEPIYVAAARAAAAVEHAGNREEAVEVLG